MKLNTASNVCEKINENANYAFLFTPKHVNWDKKADRFIEKFADEYGLKATTVSPGIWAFTHDEHGLLNDGVIELDRRSSIPLFITRDVSKAKITHDSPDIHQDMAAVKDRLNDTKDEYTSKLKGALAMVKESLDDLSTNMIHSKDDIDTELVDLQKRYQLAMGKLHEIQDSTVENYEALKARVEKTLISLKHSIDETASKLGPKS